MKKLISVFMVLLMLSCSKESVYVPVNDITLDVSSFTIIIGESKTILATVSPSNASNKIIIWTSSSQNIVSVKEGVITAKSEGTATITAKTDDGGIIATCVVTAIIPQAVDLGLSVKWAICNVGSSKPEEFGNYYSWGETEVKDYFDVNEYEYYRNGEYQGIGNDISGSLLDVAHVKWGGHWRMPTQAECEELVSNCTTKSETINGVFGCRFISKINNNSIFLPAAGSYFNDINHMGNSEGAYWCSTIEYGDYDSANCLNFYSINNLQVYASTEVICARFNGLTVRPVLDY